MPIVEAIKTEFTKRAIPVDLWMDITHLRPGQQWQSEIENALEASVGALFFMSNESAESDWMREVMHTARETPDRLIIPVLLDSNVRLPLLLRQFNGIDLSQSSGVAIASAADNIATALEAYLRKTPAPRSPVTRTDAPAIAASLARELRSTNEPTADKGLRTSVFVVHGHNDTGLKELEEFLVSIGIEPVFLSRQGESAQSLFQKFLAVGSRAEFAVVLLSADDYGASRRQYEAKGVADRALQFRARQNVILELGFFYGRLGWEKVFVVYEDPAEVFPNFERPSDLDGVLFDSMKEPGWRRNLSTLLAKAGFAISRSA